MIEKIRKKSKELLKSKQVELVIGYKRAADGVLAAPAFITSEEKVNELIWDAHCLYNLANYLLDYKGKKVAIIAKTCDVKSIIVLLQENQIKREDVIIIGVECAGIINEDKLTLDKGEVKQIDLAEKCKVCKSSVPEIYDELINLEKEKQKVEKVEEDQYKAIRKFEVKSMEEKFNFWEKEFSRCIRCYACRQVCPLCYCPQCVAEQTMPGWFSKATSSGGNFAWNVTRAIHLAGRCIDCGECERACPVGIPLKDINKKIEKDIKEMFGYDAGVNIEQKPLFSSFDKNDPEDFIK